MAKKASKVGIVVGVAAVLAVAALGVSIVRNVQKPDEETTQTLESEDFVFERTAIRYTWDMTESDGVQLCAEYRISSEKKREILTAGNKRPWVAFVNYEKYIEPFMTQGFSYEETIDAMLVTLAEKSEKDLNTMLLGSYNNSSALVTNRTVDEYGETKDVMRAVSSSWIEYDLVNTRFIPVALILTNNNGEMSYEPVSLGGKSLSDLEVSCSSAYLASLYLNQMMMYEQPYNATVADLCREVVNKACAQASGYTEEEYESGVTVGAPIKSGTTITMKVGETKKFVPEQLIDVQLRLDYIVKDSAGDGNNWQGYTIDDAGNITALKAGTYTVYVRCAGVGYEYTLHITA